VLNGVITECQLEQDRRARKYVIEGTTRLGSTASVVVKLAARGKLVFITVYRL
jgi:hypothetical protein